MNFVPLALSRFPSLPPSLPPFLSLSLSSSPCFSVSPPCLVFSRLTKSQRASLSRTFAPEARFLAQNWMHVSQGGFTFDLKNSDSRDSHSSIPLQEFTKIDRDKIEETGGLGKRMGDACRVFGSCPRADAGSVEMLNQIKSVRFRYYPGHILSILLRQLHNRTIRDTIRYSDGSFALRRCKSLDVHLRVRA